VGGRAAAEIVRKDVSTGAGNDLERATDLARKMVCEWGMSEKMGPLTFGKKEEQIFLGREIAQHRDYSEDTAVKIDQEVSSIIMKNYERAMKLLNGNLDLLHRLAKELLDREVLDNNEIEKIINAVMEAGVAGFTVTDVCGLGGAASSKEQWSIEYCKKYSTVTKLEIVSHDKDAESIVDIIRAEAYTGHRGDGMIFTSPISGAVRIRTGESGEEALKSADNNIVE